MAKLRKQLDAKAEEMAGVGMVMVHDLLVLTNDFLADKDREDGERGVGRRGSKESLFEKMVTEEQRQRERRVRPVRVLPTLFSDPDLTRSGLIFLLALAWYSLDLAWCCLA